MTKKKHKSLVIPTIRRFPSYLRFLRDLDANGQKFVSTTLIGDKFKLDSVVVRKDLGMTDIVGKPKVGYVVKDLIKALENYLGWDDQKTAFIVGMGNLGQALLGYSGFDSYGLAIIGGFDTNPDLIGKTVGETPIFDISELTKRIKQYKVEMLILTVPKEEAQRIAVLAVEAGVKGIWNFTPTKLDLPEHIIVQKEDMAAGLAVLSAKLFHGDNTQDS